MKIWNEIWDYVKMIIIVVVVVLVINNVVLINAKIPSESMENTIMTGDRIFGYRLAYGLNLDLFGKEISKKWKDPERFDIVIFKYPDDESQLFIKRIIGLPGDKVEIRNGKVYINDSETPLEDDYVPETPLGSFGPYEVPENCYFMMEITEITPRIPDTGQTLMYVLTRSSEKLRSVISRPSNF